MKQGLEGFEGFAIEEDDTWRVQACVSPVWDTCLALIAMLESGVPANNPDMESATRWLIDRQILQGGDWQVKAPDIPPGGWAFEFANDNYPDIDDVSEVLIALNLARLPGDEDGCRTAAIERGVSWLLGMQSANGGWAAFDKDNDRTYLSNIPFADFGESLDPPASTSPPISSKPWASSATTATSNPSREPIDTSATSRKKTAPGSDAGASTTSTAQAPSCPPSSPSAKT